MKLPFPKVFTEMPFAKMTEVRLRRSSRGRLLGYGELIFESVLQDQALRTINYVPYPEVVFAKVRSVIFPSTKNAGRQAGPRQAGGGAGIGDDLGRAGAGPNAA